MSVLSSGTGVVPTLLQNCLMVRLLEEGLGLGTGTLNNGFIMQNTSGPSSAVLNYMLLIWVVLNDISIFDLYCECS